MTLPEGVEQITMPSGEACFYQDLCKKHLETPDPPCSLCGNEGCRPSRCAGGNCHSYWPSVDLIGKRGHRLAGISGIASNNGDTNADGLLSWALKLEAEGTPWRCERNRKAVIGNAAHAVLEHLSEHDEVPPFSGGHSMAVIAWWKARRPEVTHSEQVVYHAKGGFAGRFDLLYGDEAPTLLDLKSGAIRTSAVVQMQLYAIACEAAELPTPKRLVILDTHSDGAWREIEVPVKPAWGLAALEIYRSGKEMGKALREAEKNSFRGHAAAPPAEVKAA